MDYFAALAWLLWRKNRSRSMRELIWDALYAFAITGLVALSFAGIPFALLSLALILGHIALERKAFLGW